MKNLILLTFLTLIVACGKESPKVTTYEEEKGLCEQLVNKDFEDKQLSVSSGSSNYYYSIYFLTVNSNCDYDITLKTNGLECDLKGDVTINDDSIEFKPNSGACSNGLEDEEIKTLSCDKNQLLNNSNGINCELK